ncbi:MAG: hypothetical protein IK125_09970 [Lachnospiraceae bacterium]|nr:hypothetical protein [Lachnospiraceae bacterium]
MKMRKIWLFISALGLVLSMMTCIAYAYGKQETGTVAGVNVIVSNSISSNKKEASATTWTSSPSADASVSVSFYWVDTQTRASGVIHAGNGNYGSITVNAPSLEGTNRYYYMVVSDHVASYGGQTFSYSGLTATIFDP